MVYRLLADGIVLLHLAFIVFVVAGGLLVLWRRWVAWIHLPAAAWGAMAEWMGWMCPLTPLENHLRVLARDGAYEGGFIEHYLMALIYPAGLTRGVQIALGIVVTVLNIAIYAWIMHGRRPRRTTQGPAA